MKFKDMRTAANLTQADIEKKLSLSKSAVSKWENDKARPRLIIIAQLSKILSVSESELLACFTQKKEEQ